MEGFQVSKGKIKSKKPRSSGVTLLMSDELIKHKSKVLTKAEMKAHRLDLDRRIAQYNTGPQVEDRPYNVEDNPNPQSPTIVVIDPDIDPETDPENMMVVCWAIYDQIKNVSVECLDAIRFGPETILVEGRTVKPPGSISTFWVIFYDKLKAPLTKFRGVVVLDFKHEASMAEIAQEIKRLGIYPSGAEIKAQELTPASAAEISAKHRNKLIIDNDLLDALGSGGRNPKNMNATERRKWKAEQRLKPSTFQLLFFSDDRKADDTLIGVSMFDFKYEAPVPDVIKEAWDIGLNPGGAVAVIELRHAITDNYKNRIITDDETLTKLGLKPLPADIINNMAGKVCIGCGKVHDSATTVH
jgi:hypothetical protein